MWQTDARCPECLYTDLPSAIGKKCPRCDKAFLARHTWERPSQAAVLLEVVCLTCGGQVVASARADQAAAEALLQSAHYNAHPHPHGLMLRVGGEWPPPGGHTLEMACKAPSCGSRFPASLRYGGPAHLLGAMSICFHSMHEGHPLEMRVDGQLLFPSL